MPEVNPRSYDELSTMAAELRELAGITGDVDIGMITGSGMADLAGLLIGDEHVDVAFGKIPGMPTTTVSGHPGFFRFGRIGSFSVVIQSGRIHPYENGCNLALCTVPVRLMKLLGCRFLIASNAAGAVNTAYDKGDFMVYEDHIFLPGLVGLSPLSGPHDPRWGERFVPSGGIYNAEWRAALLSSPSASSIVAPHALRVGTYVMVAGPQYESAAEVRFLERNGADAVGMSVSHEALVAHQMGMRVLAICLITNDRKTNAAHLSDAEVQEESAKQILKTASLMRLCFEAAAGLEE